MGVNGSEAEAISPEGLQTIETLKAKAFEKLAVAEAIKKKKRTFTFGELYKIKDEEQKFLIPEFIPAGAVTVFLGEDGIGKTQLCNQLCICLDAGLKHFLGMPLNSQTGRSLVVATEDSRKKWITAMVKQTEIIHPGVKPEEVKISFTEGADFDDFKELEEEIDERLKEQKHDLLILDALSDLFTLIDGEINSNTHARKILAALQRIANEYEIAIIIIHHAAKTKIAEKHKLGKLLVEKNDAQGAGAITQKARTVIALSNDPGSIREDGALYNNYFHVVKANLMGKYYMQNVVKLTFTARDLVHRSEGTVDAATLNNVTAEEVAEVNNTFNTRKLTPQEISPAAHYEILNKAFGLNGELPRKALVERLKEGYKVGQTKIEQEGGFLLYLVEKNYLQRTSTGGFKYLRVNTVQEEEEPPF